MRGKIEQHHCDDGLTVAGIDEVGRGCLAGPVWAGFTVLDYSRLWDLDENTRELIRDSKRLSARQRQKVVPVIETICRDRATASSSPREIERHGIREATFLAMRRALAKSRVPIDVLLIDGNAPLGGYKGHQEPVVKGDHQCYTIAAASILAKEERDSYMHEQATAFPAYGFEKHVGYGTRTHLDMIEQHGVCDLHRRNFAPIKAQLSQPALFDD